MLKHIPPALRSGLVVVAVALLPLHEAAATGGGVVLPTGVGAPPERSCSIPAGPGAYPPVVQVIAGPGPAGTPFPLTVTNSAPGTVTDGNCPATPGTCLRWDYQWVYPAGVNPAHAYVTLDSDLNLLAAVGGYPPRVVNAPSILGDLFLLGVGAGVTEARVVRFNANAATFNASIYTATNAQVGKVTAGFLSPLLKRGFCAIQGAEKPPVDALLSKPQTITTTVGICTVNWTQSADGCVTGATTTTPGCTIVDRDLVVNGQVATTATCGTEVAGPFGSTEVCKWNSLLRKTTCVRVP